MKNISQFTIVVLFFLVFLSTSILNAQEATEIELFCPADPIIAGDFTCGSEDEFGAVQGIYADNGMVSEGQKIYTGPGASNTYTIKCVELMQEIAPGFFFTVYRWELRNSSDELIYFESSQSDVNPFPFPASAYEWANDNSNYTPAPEELVLPVELVDFSLKNDKKEVFLYWQTASETINEGFEIERSFNGRDWESLDFVAGQGTTYDTHDYYFTDKQPLSGLNYYRLKQTDYDANFTYSGVIKTDFSQARMFVFPNPVSASEVNIQFPNADFNEAVTEIYDYTGQLVRSITTTNTILSVNISDLLPGFYIVSVKVGGQMFQERLIKK